MTARWNAVCALTGIAAVVCVVGVFDAAADDGIRARLKARVSTPLAAALVDEGFRRQPVLTWLAGWDFQDRRWKLNEYINQTTHQLIGSLTTPFLGRWFTLGLAVAVEAEQFVDNDHYDLKLMDRVRDTLFYLMP